MNLKEIGLKAIAPVAVIATVIASGAGTSVLSAFVVSNTVPSNCIAGYGYDAGYGYGYGYDTGTCVRTSSGGGGGGSSSNPSNPSNPSDPWDDTDTPVILTGESVSGDVCNATSSVFDGESKSAYLFACKNDITTKRDINTSLFNGILIRKEMAKMISNYAINVMGLTPDTSKVCNFNDIANEDAEMKQYIKTACQLGLMGYKGDAVTQADAFNPNQAVSRAMFGTLFARMLYGTDYATATDAVNWYGPSLNALKADSILKVIDPTMTEIRGYVWIVFDRASN